MMIDVEKWIHALNEKGIGIKENERGYWEVYSTHDGRFINSYKHKKNALKKGQELVDWERRVEETRVARLREKPSLSLCRDIGVPLSKIYELQRFMQDRQSNLENDTKECRIVAETLQYLWHDLQVVSERVAMLETNILNLARKDVEGNHA